MIGDTDTADGGNAFAGQMNLRRKSEGRMVRDRSRSRVRSDGGAGVMVDDSPDSVEVTFPSIERARIERDTHSRISNNLLEKYGISCPCHGSSVSPLIAVSSSVS